MSIQLNLKLIFRWTFHFLTQQFEIKQSLNNKLLFLIVESFYYWTTFDNIYLLSIVHSNNKRFITKWLYFFS